MDGRTMIQVEFVAIDYISCFCQRSSTAISEVEKEWGSSGQHRCGFQYPICQKMELVYPYHSSTMAIVHTGSNQQCSALSGDKKLKYIHEQSEKQNMERLQPSRYLQSLAESRTKCLVLRYICRIVHTTETAANTLRLSYHNCRLLPKASRIVGQAGRRVGNNHITAKTLWKALTALGAWSV